MSVSIDNIFLSVLSYSSSKPFSATSAFNTRELNVATPVIVLRPSLFGIVIFGL